MEVGGDVALHAVRVLEVALAASDVDAAAGGGLVGDVGVDVYRVVASRLLHLIIIRRRSLGGKSLREQITYWLDHLRLEQVHCPLGVELFLHHLTPLQLLLHKGPQHP